MPGSCSVAPSRRNAGLISISALLYSRDVCIAKTNHFLNRNNKLRVVQGKSWSERLGITCSSTCQPAVCAKIVSSMNLFGWRVKDKVEFEHCL